MDIDRVRYFHIIAETGSLVKASEILHISQPALSKALKVLQSEIGLILVEPDGRGLRLTDKGERFKKETAPLLQNWQDVVKKVLNATSVAPTRIGSFEVFTTYFLSLLMKNINLENLEIHEFIPGLMEKAIVEGIIDLGITYAPIPHAGVEFIEVTKIKMGVFGKKDSHKNIQFSQLPFVIPLQPAQGTPSKVIGLDGWPDHKFQRNIKFKVTMMESALELCRGGYCVAYLPDFVVKLHNEHACYQSRLVEFDSPIPKKSTQQSVYLVRRQNSTETKLDKLVAKCLRTLE